MRKGIMIELTALLDVILILFFAILVTAGQEVEATAAQGAKAAAQLQTQLEETLAEKEELNAHLGLLTEENAALRRFTISSEILEENSLIITLSVKNNGEARTVAVEWGQESQSIPLDWNNENYVSNALRLCLEKVISAAKEPILLIVFQYDRNEIYISDYNLVSAAISAHKQNSRVYLAEYDIRTQGGHS